MALFQSIMAHKIKEVRVGELHQQKNTDAWVRPFVIVCWDGDEIHLDLFSSQEIPLVWDENI